ncbi:MAG: sulfite exporter TauE/SafE family protein [Oscillospiraceae bacterium]|nr:sulfite exporter TauE/SafE family protein [Oscillospiraceae bacterium]
MQYFTTFLEGIVTFISPCILPMLPIYVSYFAGGGERKTSKTLKCALGFILGFTIIFILLGALAGAVGSFLRRYETVVNLISGLIIIFFGLNFMGVFKLHLFRGIHKSVNTDNLSFFSSLLFGIIFSVCHTPCVGAFLGSALVHASQQGHVITGILMLLSYSLGLGIPFIISALLIDSLKSAFAFIKRNYKIINIISGSFLILVGIMIATGTLEGLLALLTPEVV